VHLSTKNIVIGIAIIAAILLVKTSYDYMPRGQLINGIRYPQWPVVTNLRLPPGSTQVRYDGADYILDGVGGNPFPTRYAMAFRSSLSAEEIASHFDACLTQHGLVRSRTAWSDWGVTDAWFGDNVPIDVKFYYQRDGDDVHELIVDDRRL
jgi:hypothetical protein